MTNSFIRQIKRITATAIVVFSVIVASPFVSADSLAHEAPERVRIGEDGTADFDIKVTGVDVYAGAQFELILGEGVEILEIAFDKGTSAGIIPPTFARGSYFFSLISGTNGYEGDFTCTVSISYGGKEPAEIIVAEIQTYFIKKPGNVATTVDGEESVIEVLPFGYVEIGDEKTPLAFFRENWLWLLLAAAAGVAASYVFIRLRNKIKTLEQAVKGQSAGEEPLTIDNGQLTVEEEFMVEGQTEGSGTEAGSGCESEAEPADKSDIKAEEGDDVPDEDRE